MARQKTNTKEMCLRMTPQDWAVLERAAEMTGMSCSACVRQLVRAYLAPQTLAGVVFPGKPAMGPVTLDLSGLPGANEGAES